ncbi:MAG: class II aldolase/adducin family protein [Acidimicrobiales bacterium]
MEFEMHPPTDLSVVEERTRRKREAALGYRIFASYGWGDDGAGHITARDPELLDHMWVLREGVAFRHAAPDELVLIDPDGKIVEGNDSQGFNITSYNIHHPIHSARPDIVSAAHTHTGYGTPLAALCEPIVMNSQEACAFHDDQAVYLGDNLDVVDRSGGEAIAESLATNKLVLMGNHGMLTVGSSVAAAIGFFVLAERAAEVHMKARSGRIVDAAAASRTGESIGTEYNGWLVFQYLVASRLD